MGGHDVTNDESVEASAERYRQQCRQRRDRDRIAGQLERRRDAEERADRRHGAEAAVRVAAAAGGVVAAEDLDPEAIVAELETWRAAQERRLDELGERHELWTGLQVALDGRTVAELDE